MKLAKVGFLAALMAGLFVPSYAEEDTKVDLLPTMSSQSTAANQAWVGAFQLVWNDATENLGEVVAASRGAQAIVEELNKKSFTTNDLSDSAYYINHGRTTIELKNIMEEGIKEKFDEESQILNKFSWDGTGFIIYSMLKKDFEFQQEFNDMGTGAFGRQGAKVEYFGTNKVSIMESNVYPLFYNGRRDFAVRLNTKTGDEVYLFRTDEKGTLEDLYNSMQEKMENWRDGHNVDPGDTFKAPKIKFEVERNFEELVGVEFENGSQISMALENLEFSMDKAGVKVKAEAAIVTTRGAVSNWHFNFDDRYVIFVQEQGKKPYFALLVEDPTKLQ